MSAYSNYRNVSIYNDQKQFKHDNEELLLAKDYNRKVFNASSNGTSSNDPKQQYLRGSQSTQAFQNPVHSQYLSNNLKLNREVRANNPNFMSGNPITHEGKPADDFRPTVKKTQHSDIDNFKAANDWESNTFKSPEKQFKPSSKQIEVRPSDHYEHFGKRHLKTTTPYADYMQTRNPILQGDGLNSVEAKPRSVAGDYKVSNEYVRLQENKHLLPADRNITQKGATSQIFFGDDSTNSMKRVTSPKERIPLKHTGIGCKDLLSNGNHAESGQRFTAKCTELDPKERAIKYGELNYYCDYRKRSKTIKRLTLFLFLSFSSRKKFRQPKTINSDGK